MRRDTESGIVLGMWIGAAIVLLVMWTTGRWP